jgi:hypothetical protein
MRRGLQDIVLGPKTPLGPRPAISVAALAGVLGMAASAGAETWTVVPSLSLGATYDDNLFFVDSRLGAAGLRAGPALNVEYQPSARFKMLGRAGLDSEYFGEPEASSWAARRNAGLTASYRLGEYTTASLVGDYALTAYASELLPSVGVEYGRRAAESVGSKRELEHRFSPQITLRAGYGMQAFQLERSGPGRRSQLATDADFIFRLAPHTTLSVQLGPRYLARSFSGHVAATLERALPRGRFSVTYERGRSLAFDRTLLIESYTARFSGTLSRALTVTASPALFRQWEHSVEERTWHVGGAVLYRAQSWLTVFVNHGYVVLDRGLFIDSFTRRRGPPQLSRNTLTAGVILMPRRVREESRQ